MHVPKAKIWHKISASTNKNSNAALYYGIRNYFLLIKKNGKYWHKVIYYPYFILSKVILLSYLLAINKKRVLYNHCSN